MMNLVRGSGRKGEACRGEEVEKGERLDEIEVVASGKSGEDKLFP